MSKRFLCLALVLSLPLGGCAYLTNYTRPVDLREGSISIDVKQRVVFSQTRLNKDKAKETIVCAEPSPDALTVLGASGGLSVTAGTGRASNLTGALAETGSSIGLRTQSIQLLRDAMYRLCEGYAGGAVSESDFSAMQRRYQSTMMGLIAIEQLTGPIVASQTMLASSASSQAGALSGDAAADGAKTNADLASTAALEAETNLDSAKSTLEVTRQEMKAVDEQLRAEQAKKAAKKEFDQSSIDSLLDRSTRLSKQEKANINDIADKQRRVEDKRKKLADAEAELRQAKAKASAGAGGIGRLGDVASATRASNEAFASAVTAIVTEINRSYSRDGCLALVTELIKSGKQPSGMPFVDSKRIQVLEAELRERLATSDELDAINNKVLDALNREKARNNKQDQALLEADLEGVKRRKEQQQESIARLNMDLQRARNPEAIVDPVLKAGMEVCRDILRLDLVAAEKANYAPDGKPSTSGTSQSGK